MSPKRRDPVAPPPGPEEWQIRFHTNEAIKGWEELCRQAPGNTLAAWMTMRRNPAPPVKAPRHHRLPGELATGSEGGRVLDRWQTLRPGARVALRWRGTQPPPAVPADRCLGQAILNLLDNAADSAPDKEVELNCSYSPRSLRILIQDRGPGLQQSVTRAEPGQRLLTTKGEKGTGIGLLLAKTAIQRFGGTLKLSNRAGGGARAQVILPLRIATGGTAQTKGREFHVEENHAKPEERSPESAARGR